MSEMVEGAAQIRTSLTPEKRNLILTTLPLIRALHHSSPDLRFTPNQLQSRTVTQ
jgi:hypothetical protein